jgi:uncharacterized repeat protein (TIGR03803 family)
VFRRTPDGTFAILHSFAGGAEGSAPTALVQAMDGDLYGRTSLGGATDNGTVFRLSPDGTLTTLHDLAYPNSYYRPRSIIQATDGNFYLSNGYDVVRMTPDGTFTVMHTFNGDDGSLPEGLLQARNGAVYGTNGFTVSGGGGTVFRMTLDGAVTVLHAFAPYPFEEGHFPDAAPVLANDGNLYGTTRYGGGVYRITLDDRLQTRRGGPVAAQLRRR